VDRTPEVEIKNSRRERLAAHPSTPLRAGFLENREKCGTPILGLSAIFKNQRGKLAFRRSVPPAILLITFGTISVLEQK